MEQGNLGETIKMLRESKRLTQKKLAEGICHQSEISRIEQGKSLPELPILGLLAARLGVPSEYFLNVLFRKRQLYILEIEKVVEEYLDKKEYEVLFQFTKKELEIKVNKQDYNIYYYLLYYHRVAENETGRSSYEQTIDTLIVLLTKVKNNAIYIYDWLLEKQIANSIAIYSAQVENYKQSIYYYEQVISNYPREAMINDDFIIKIHYNYSKSLYALADYNKSLSMIEEGISLAKKMKSMSYLGQLYYQRGQCKEKFELPMREITADYFYALLTFKQIGNETLKELVLEQKKDFLGHNQLLTALKSEIIG